MCAFCARTAKSRDEALKRRGVITGFLVGLLLTASVAGGAVALWPRLSQSLDRRATPVTPEPSRPAPVFVEVTHESISIDGQRVWDLPAFSEQARVGVKPGVERAEIQKLLRAAVDSAFKTRPHEPGVVELSLAPDTPAKVVNQVWVAGDGYAQRMSVKASRFGPATTVHSPKDSIDVKTHALYVEVRTHGVALWLNNGRYLDTVGGGCKLGEEGIAVMLRRPTDYAVLKRCFDKLHAQLSPDLGAHPHVTALDNVPAARLFHVVDLLRCGELSCTDDQPRVWDWMTIGRTDEYGAATDEMVPILMMRLEPALRACWDGTHAALPEPSYETELRLDLDDKGKVTPSITPGLPPPLEACVNRVISEAEFKLPQSQPRTRHVVPLPFGD